MLDRNLAHVTTWGTCDKPLKNHEVLTWASKDVDITSIKPFILSSNFGCLWIASGLPGVCQATKLKRPCAVKIDGSTSQKTIRRNNSNGEWMSNLQWKQAAGCGKTCSGSCLRQPTARHSLIAVVAVMNGTTFLLRTTSGMAPTTRRLAVFVRKHTHTPQIEYKHIDMI